MTNYLGNYEYYLEKKDEQLALIEATQATGSMQPSSGSKGSSTVTVADENASESKLDWKSQKELQAAQRKKENDLKKCEDRIEQLETRNAEIDELMASPEICTNVAKLQELNKEKEENDTVLASLYEQWENLSES